MPHLLTGATTSDIATAAGYHIHKSWTPTQKNHLNQLSLGLVKANQINQLGFLGASFYHLLSHPLAG
jgi:hypothetical protein